MTTAEYQKYIASVERFLSINQVKPGCHSPVNPEASPFFSWSPCECCGSPLGGNRETYSFATEPSFETFKADICVDCVYFLTYGQLDDMTMLEMTEEVFMTVTRENYFEIAEACHCWLSLNHEGQWSNTYKLLCRSEFKPGPMWSESRCESENEYLPFITRDNVEELMNAIDALINELP